MPKFLNLIQYVDDGADWETNPNDNETGLRTIKLSQDNKPGTTIMRDPGGRAKISNPVDKFDIANRGYIDDKWDKFPLTIGGGEYSVIQKRIKSDGTTTKTEAYQRGTAAFGGGTVAGDPNGVATDYSFAFAANENNKAIPRASAAFGRYNTAHNIGEFVCGDYADNNRNPETVFAVGTGYSDARRSTGFEVRKDGRCYSSGEPIATENYVEINAVHKEGTAYVLYGTQGLNQQAVIPYRFQRDSIINPEYTVMFQPMYDGRLYTRDPEDDWHAANKRFVVKEVTTAVATGQTNFPLTTGKGEFSVVQRRRKSNGNVVPTTAYQRGSMSVGGDTVAGKTYAEWKVDNPEGTEEQYNSSYSFAFAANENNGAKARSSAAFGRYNTTYNPGEFVCGNYAKNTHIEKQENGTYITKKGSNPDTVFTVGGGTVRKLANDSTEVVRHNAFEVRTNYKTVNGELTINSSAFIGGKAVATQEYVGNNAVKKMGNSYVVYTNGGKDENGNVIGEVIPYRFNKTSIEQAEFPLMFQPMVNGKLYTRTPTDELHAANKGYVDKLAYNYLGESTVSFTPPVVGVTDPAGVKTIIFNNFNSDLTLYDSFYLKIEATLDKDEFLANTQYANHYINCNNEDEAVVVRKFGADNRTFETIIAIEKNSHDKYLFEMSGTTDYGTKRVTSFSFGNREKNSISLSGVFYQNGGSWGTIKVKLYGRRLCIIE